MSKRLVNKTAIITGAAKGIGLTISKRFAIEGANVVLADIDEKSLEKSKKNISLISTNSEFVVTDITSKKSINNLIQNTLMRFSKINILINNAGIAPNNLIENQSLEEWEKVIRTNLTGYFLCSKAVVESMNNIGGGHIVNISSISGQRGSVGRSAYGVSKAGITSDLDQFEEPTAEPQAPEPGQPGPGAPGTTPGGGGAIPGGTGGGTPI